MGSKNNLRIFINTPPPLLPHKYTHIQTHTASTEAVVNRGKEGGYVSYSYIFNVTINCMNHRKEGIDLGIVETNCVMCLKMY